ncbi:hypothetical protein B7463_g9592, partial [Scytalidium lignicola]
MAKIYGQANRVVVWLGKATNDSDLALEEIRLAASKMSTHSSNKAIQQAVLALFQRPWFRRIWVLQEVASARYVVIMCGLTEIDGYVFCLVTYLINGAIFRPNYGMNMYHTHEATKRHDKVYALLGMSSDDLSETSLLPNYGVPWEELLQRLVKFLLCNEILVETWDDKEIAVIQSKGCILGKVSLVQNDISLDNRQNVGIIFKRGLPQNAGTWSLQNSAKYIRKGDLICLLQGASKPTIIRPYKDYFSIIMIAPTSPEHIQMSGDVKWPKVLQLVKDFNRDFLLVWDWENSLEKLQDSEEYETLVQRNNWISQHSKTESNIDLNKATRTWNVALILGDLVNYGKVENYKETEEYKNAMERLQEAIEGYKMAFGIKQSHSPTYQNILTPLSWAAWNGCSDVINLLLEKNNVDPDLKDSQYDRTPLSWAAESGYEVIVKLLLETDKVDVSSKDKYGQTPLLWAAKKGHEAIVKLLLKTGKVDVDLKNKFDRTPLSWAAEGGHEAVVKLLLETGKVNVDLKDKYSQTPLSWAAGKGHENVVKLLLETGKVDIESKDVDSWTPLTWATQGGHEAVVKLLREKGYQETQ